MISYIQKGKKSELSFPSKDIFQRYSTSESHMLWGLTAITHSHTDMHLHCSLQRIHLWLWTHTQVHNVTLPLHTQWYLMAMVKVSVYMLGKSDVCLSWHVWSCYISYSQYCFLRKRYLQAIEFNNYCISRGSTYRAEPSWRLSWEIY